MSPTNYRTKYNATSNYSFNAQLYRAFFGGSVFPERISSRKYLPVHRCLSNTIPLSVQKRFNCFPINYSDGRRRAGDFLDVEKRTSRRTDSTDARKKFTIEHISRSERGVAWRGMVWRGVAWGGVAWWGRRMERSREVFGKQQRYLVRGTVDHRRSA